MHAQPNTVTVSCQVLGCVRAVRHYMTRKQQIDWYPKILEPETELTMAALINYYY